MRSILLVPFADGIGDFVNMLPIISAVQDSYPLARLAVAASPHARDLLPDERVTVLTPSWLRRKANPTMARYRWLLSQSLVAVLSSLALRRELGRFDLAINLFRAWETGMTFERDWTPQLPARGGAVHTLDFLAEHLTRWGVSLPPERRAPHLVVRPGARAWADDLWRSEGLGAEPVVGLVPASNMAIKHWPLPRWATLNDQLRSAGVRTVLFAPEPDHPAARALRATTSPPTSVTTDLVRVAASLERCSVVVAVDTGLLHMAAAVGTPYVGLFGPTNPDVTGPYDRSLGICLVAPVPKAPSCGGCWKHFKYEDDRCRTFEQGSCAALLDGESVLTAVMDTLGRREDLAPLALGEAG
jgi:heptosyltransferase I